MTEQTGEYTKTTVGIDTQQLGRAPRRLFAATLIVAFVTMVTATIVTYRFGKVFAELDTRKLPIPTEVVLAISKALQHPLGMGVAVFAVATMVMLGIKGLLDRFLKLLIGLNVIWLALFLLATVTTWSAVRQIAEKLKSSAP